MKIRSILFSLGPILFLLQGNVSGQLNNVSLDIKALPPAASITSIYTDVCLGDSVLANITFSGDGPWDAVINDDDGEYKVLDGVTSPYVIYLKPQVDNTYYIASVSDKVGQPGTTVGTVPLSVHESTPVTINLEKRAYLYSDPGVALQSDPPGGKFQGEGVATNSFYPGIATPVGSPHAITCIYTNQFGCKSSDEIDIHVLYGGPRVYLISGEDTINAVCDDAGTYLIRGSNKDNIPGKFKLVVAGTNEPQPGHITDEDTLDDLASLDITGLKGAYDIIYTYQFLQLVDSASYRFIINDLGIIKIADFPDAVCKNDEPYLLVPELAENDPGAIYSFSGQGVTGNQANGYYYNPGADNAPVGENEIKMNYTSSNGCSSSSVQKVTNNFVPDVKFSLSPVCIPSGGGTVSFRNLTSGKYSVDKWIWNFGDPGSGSDNTSSSEHSEHFYSEAGEYQIGLTANTRTGCVVPEIVDTVLTDEPEADFTWLSDCFARGSEISFVDRSTSSYGVIDTFIWTFRTASGGVLGWDGTGSSTDTVLFQFPSLNSYFVKLQIENQAGCTGEVTREIKLKPIVPVPASGYENDFNGAKSDWYAVSANQNQSWKLGEPDFDGFISTPGDYAWHTDLPVHTTGFREASWIESPCFDFSAVEKPLIQIDLMKSFDPGVDGAVLQYQEFLTDGWKTLGKVGEGMNWYNSNSILNKPGGSSFGWGLEIFNPDTEWLNATHDLDEVALHTGVKFRIIIGTGGEKEIGNQGFAFDNIFIGERVKKSLLEYFTNSSSTECSTTDQLVDNYAVNHSSSVVDLQYHMDFPGTDQMNEKNTLVPFTRFFQKGVSGVPYAILNGGAIPEHRYDFSGPFSQPGEEELEQASLALPVFDLDLSVDWMENGLDATIGITCKTETFSSDLDLYLAVMETSVTAYTGMNQDTMFRNVVLDMLTSPSGDWIGNIWNNGVTESRSYSWNYVDYIEDIEDLAVVAFLQERDKGEVLQVVTNYLTPQVGLVFRKLGFETMTVYPNPAADYLFVNLGTNNEPSGELSLMDLSGKIVLKQKLETGFSIYRLDVSHLQEGMYVIYLTGSGSIQGRNKVILTR